MAKNDVVWSLQALVWLLSVSGNHDSSGLSPEFGEDRLSVITRRLLTSLWILGDRQGIRENSVWGLHADAEVKRKVKVIPWWPLIKSLTSRSRNWHPPERTRPPLLVKSKTEILLGPKIITATWKPDFANEVCRSRRWESFPDDRLVYINWNGSSAPFTDTKRASEALRDELESPFQLVLDWPSAWRSVYINKCYQLLCFSEARFELATNVASASRYRSSLGCCRDGPFRFSKHRDQIQCYMVLKGGSRRFLLLQFASCCHHLRADVSHSAGPEQCSKPHTQKETQRPWHISSDKKLNWLPFKQRINFKIATLASINTLPSYCFYTF